MNEEITRLIDDLGEVKEQIADLEAQEKAIQAELERLLVVPSLPVWLKGDRYSCDIEEYQRESVSIKKARELLSVTDFYNVREKATHIRYKLLPLDNPKPRVVREARPNRIAAIRRRMDKLKSKSAK